MVFKSEIRDSVINGLLDKAAKRNYDKFLSKIILKRIRGFVDESISFDFPVTALIGPNGGGKTTVLGAVGCAYKAMPPKRFFAKSGNYDESMQDWAIEYELIDRKLSKKDTVRRTARFRNQRWKRDALDRKVLIFGVSRTVPVNERPELKKCTSSSFSVSEENIQELSEPVKQAVSRILGKDITGFNSMKIDRKGRVVLLTGRTTDKKIYSEFHFGAGESSVIRMVSEIELIDNNNQAIVLIEEIENGLHPIATIKMVEYLVEAADRKKLQAVFTTHSNDALKPLPSKAIWVAIRDRIFQGKLDIHSLRAITGQIEAKLVIFVEDQFAKIWIEAILRQTDNIAVDHIQVYGMEGDGIAVEMNKYHRLDPSSKVPSICIVDGDSKQTESKEYFIYRLPGQSPEEFIFDEVLSVWESFGGKLSVALLQKFENEKKVKEICNLVRMNNRDAHLLYAQVGEKLSLIPKETVEAAFANIWAQAFPDKITQLIKNFNELIPCETAKTT